MTYSDYLKRAAVMLLVAMPLTAIALSLAELVDATARTEGAISIVAGAFGMVYVWGALSGLAVSLLHTVASSALRPRTLGSIAIALVLAMVGGALTPTLFTGLMNGPTILWAGVAGILYGLFESRLRERTRSVSEVGIS